MNLLCLFSFKATKYTNKALSYSFKYLISKNTKAYFDCCCHYDVLCRLLFKMKNKHNNRRDGVA